MNAGTRSFGALMVAALMFLVACGGGGGSSSSSFTPTPPPQTQTLSITTATPLPGTLQGHAYSATLTATGGEGALHWSIAPISTTLYVTGLSIDSNTGVLSGTANFSGTAGFTATVTDSATPPHSAGGSFTVTASLPLAAAPPQSIGFGLYQNVPPVQTASSGGVYPLTFTFAGGAMPPGVKLRSNGQIYGAPYVSGTFTFTVNIQDSFSPPEAATQTVTITIVPPALQMPQYPLPSQLLLNRPFSGRVIAKGGVPPYTFIILSGSLPTGLGLVDPTTGRISGTPTALGIYSFDVQASDASSPPKTARINVGITVVQPIGRNDSPATATPISNGSFSGSISPYIDPPNGTPAAGDNDYYKLVSLGGSTVHLETQAKRSNANNSLDTVIEVVDGNGIRMSTCRQPGDTSTNFNGPCINDDISLTPTHIQDSALDFRVPGATNVANTFYVHVLDWRGDARPDMTYSLTVSGIVTPLSITTPPTLTGLLGAGYGNRLTAAGGSGTYSWSVTSGALPPGLTLDGAGLLSTLGAGVFTTPGTYAFTVQVSDPGPPAQAVTENLTFIVATMMQVVTTALPDGLVGTNYSAGIVVTGGLPPYTFTPHAITGGTSWPPPGIVIDSATGAISGIPTTAGSYSGWIDVTDQWGQIAMPRYTLVVQP